MIFEIIDTGKVNITSNGDMNGGYGCKNTDLNE